MARATRQDGSYPRPMLCRPDWVSLDGRWDFAHDDADVGLARRWYDERGDGPGPFTRHIEVPYPPESPASGVAATGRHPVVWYRRTLPTAALDRGQDSSRRVLAHFGAVDFRAQVWCDGRLVASHVGGQTPFTADLTDALDPEGTRHVLVLRAEDDPDAVDQPRGKQDWRATPHDIWYERTTGIWQSVWVETVPGLRVTDLAWTPDVAAAVVRAEVALSRAPAAPVQVELALRLGEETLAEVSHVVRGRTAYVDVPVPALRNAQDRDRLLWSPEQPVLVDAEVVLRERGSGLVVDAVDSYLGLRSVGVGGGAFLLNGRPCYLRSVLDQGYRPRTHLATRGTDELRAEVELVKALGFNAVRVHQKAEDPRFLYWADRLGLMVWAETANAYEFSATAAALLTTEWIDLVRRDRSHPCVVTWVPINESWGVQDIATVRAQQQLSRSLAALTRALDPSRPVVSNEGWEHLDSDILGLHDYTTDAARLRARYADRQAVLATVLSGHGPQGRRPVLDEAQERAFVEGRAPLMITEFGGLSMSSDEGSWGYAQASSASAYADWLRRLFDALRASPEIAGFCYTQLMDTGQEANGLVHADRTPKLPVETIRAIVTGNADG